MNISAVVPVYNEVEALPQFHQELTAALPPDGRHEILYIDDGSDDGSGKILR